VLAARMTDGVTGFLGPEAEEGFALSTWLIAQ
jgi:hypothetical protein